MTTKQIPQLFLSRSPLRNTVQIANEYHFIGIAIQRKLNKSSNYNFQICTQSIVASHKIIYTKDQQIANVHRGPEESIKTPIFVGILHVLYTVHCTVSHDCRDHLRGKFILRNPPNILRLGPKPVCIAEAAMSAAGGKSSPSSSTRDSSADPSCHNDPLEALIAEEAVHTLQAKAAAEKLR